MSFSFTNDSAVHLLTMAGALVPGIQKVMVVFYHTALARTEARLFYPGKDDGNIEEVFLDEAVLSGIARLRTEGSDFYWASETDLPFTMERSGIRQLDVFSEFDRNILVIPYTTATDGRHDLLLFYLHENAANFMLSNTGKPLGAEHKQIIGTLLRRSIQAIAGSQLNDQSELLGFNRNVSLLINSLKKEKQNAAEYREKHGQNLMAFARLELMRQAEKLFYSEVELTPEAEDKLRNYSGDIHIMGKVIDNAVGFAATLQYGSNHGKLILDDYHLNFDAATETSAIDNPELNVQSRYLKTLQLLDKLESAAIEVLKRNKPLTGSNVGSACRKSISAPAITDALKKHKTKIISLLKQYPERWPTIRNEFKPLINILSVRETASYGRQSGA